MFRWTTFYLFRSFLFVFSNIIITFALRMKIIYNKHFPFGSYWAINIFGIIFARKDYGKLGAVERNHEYIHTLQQREMLFVFFYIVYFMEWLVKLCYYRNLYATYRNLSFEREAYHNQQYMNYRYVRRPFAWMKYI